MSLQKREELVGKIVDEHLSLCGFIKDLPAGSCVIAGSWSLVSFGFQQGFEAFWDLAYCDNRGLLNMPLLSLWRQSIELTLKCSILEIGGRLDKKSGHKLQDLFEELTIKSTDGGLDNDDDLTKNVREMIYYTQSFDPYADRFRYPSNKNGDPYEGIEIDLDKLFQAHWIIVTYCEGTVVELREKIGIGSP